MGNQAKQSNTADSRCRYLHDSGVSWLDDAISQFSYVIKLEESYSSGYSFRAEAEMEKVEGGDLAMGDSDTLADYLVWGVQNYPADNYDLILWDHAGGPANGFAYDMHDLNGVGMMPFSGIVDALTNNVLRNTDDPGALREFDLIDFDACQMNTVELNLALADLTDYYIASAENEPGYGQEYSGWLNLIGEDPEVNTFDLGKRIVDDFNAFYEGGPGEGQEGTLARLRAP